MVAKHLHILGRGAICGLGDFLNIGEQRSFGGSEPSLSQLAFENCFDALITGSLNTQEVGMTVESIRAAIEK